MLTTQFPWKMLALLSLGLLLLSGCALLSEPTPFSEWRFTDVKILDDEAALATSHTPRPDLLALYTRETHQDIQLRLDFFDLADTADFDLYLAFDSVPGGIQPHAPVDHHFAWDTLIRIPAFGPIQILDAQDKPRQQARISVFRDPILDTLMLSASKDILPVGSPGFRVLAWLTMPGSDQMLDALPAASSHNHIPQHVNLLAAFSDSFPVYTPAQALRRWDGAHTGPSGGRHGLYNLLRITQNFQIPVVVLDLMQPSSLSALDYMEKLEVMKDLIADKLIIAPQYAPALPLSSEVLDSNKSLEIWQETNRALVSNFEIRQPHLIYSPSGLIPQNSNATVIFLVAADELHLNHPDYSIHAKGWQDKILLQLPPNGSPPQANSNGPSLEFKQAIVSAMLAAQTQPAGNTQHLLMLGGSLPSSAWGDPQAARPSLRYLASRPWLHFLNEHELLTLPTHRKISQVVPTLEQELVQPPSEQLWQAKLWHDVWQGIERAPHNAFSQAARQSYLAAANPVYPAGTELGQLRQLYVKQTWVLVSAVEWGEQPYSSTTCAIDVDQDGEADCLFTNNYLYAAFHQKTGALTHLFYRQVNNTTGAVSLHQVIGPSSQLISGLSDAGEWDLSAGFAADPGVIPGAFAQKELFSANTLLDGIRFTSQSGISKTYYFSEQGVRIVFQPIAHFPTEDSIQFADGAQPLAALKIPLMLDPWTRFYPNWRLKYQLDKIPDGWRISLVPEFDVYIRATSVLQASYFSESQAWMGLTENPNREQPGGHFLPFPMVLLQVFPAEQLEISLEIRSNAP